MRAAHSFTDSLEGSTAGEPHRFPLGGGGGRQERVYYILSSFLSLELRLYYVLRKKFSETLYVLPPLPEVNVEMR